MNQERYRIGKVYITATNPKDAEAQIVQAARDGVTDYICVSNMRTVVLANEDREYCRLMNEAFMCLPDGMPLTWMARLWGRNEVNRTDGPDLLVSMLNKPEYGLKHFLLGDTDETLNALKEKYPNANIVGVFSPPFCELNEYDYEGIAKMLNESGADVVWISMRAPKQDYFSAKLMPYIDKKMCIGVGRAFRIALGEFTEVPKLAQRLGLSGFWLRRNSLWEEIKFYVETSFYLFYYGSKIFVKRLIGRKYYI